MKTWRILMIKALLAALKPMAILLHKNVQKEIKLLDIYANQNNGK